MYGKFSSAIPDIQDCRLVVRGVHLLIVAATILLILPLINNVAEYPINKVSAVRWDSGFEGSIASSSSAGLWLSSSVRHPLHGRHRPSTSRRGIVLRPRIRPSRLRGNKIRRQQRVSPPYQPAADRDYSNKRKEETTWEYIQNDNTLENKFPLIGGGAKVASYPKTPTSRWLSEVELPGFIP